MKKGMIALSALAFALAVGAPVLAEDPAAPGAQEQRASAQSLRQEIVKLRYVRAQDIQQVVYPFLGPGGMIRFNDNMPMVLTVSAPPENIDKVLAVIRELDVKPADILYTVQLVLGSESDATTDAELQNDPVVKELRKLLRYKGYTLLDSSLLRVVNRERASVVLGPKAEFEFSLMPDVAGDSKTPVIKSEVRLRQIVRTVTKALSPDGKEIDQPHTNATTPVESTLNTKSGERTVVGVSKLDGGDKGLILIISAKIVD